MNLPDKDEKGFTLIEMMIVVAIIGIVAAIAVPIYWRVIDTARVTSAVAALDTVRLEMEAYATGSGGSYPQTIDFTNFTDQDGAPILLAVNWMRIKDKFYSWDSYTQSGGTYTLTARAMDKNHTLLTLTPQGVSH